MMKRAASLIIAGVILACLAGCGVQMPAAAADGMPWSKDWLTLGQMLGVEEPGHGLTLRDDKAAGNMSYAAWSAGEARPYMNESGEEAELYDAQLVLLLTAADTTEDAQACVDEWLGLAAENYTVTDTARQSYNGQEFTVLTYTFSSETSHFSRGVSAFAVRDAWAVSAEFVCQDAFTEDAGEILADVLEHCHYAME